MTSPDFDKLVERASRTLTDDDIAGAQDISDIQSILDRKFFVGWGDQPTRTGADLKTLVSADIVNRNKELIGSEYKREVPEVLQPARSFAQGLIGGLKSIPILSFLRNKRKKQTTNILKRMRKKRLSSFKKLLRKKKRKFSIY